MKISFAIASVVFCTVNAETLLFPIPQQVEWTGHGATLANDFVFTGAQNEHVKSAATRTLALIRQEKWIPIVAFGDAAPLLKSDPLHTLEINVTDNDIKLDIDVDESYELDIDKATLTAPTWVGALRGLETFSQLVTWTDTAMVHTAMIKDWPSYSHRGIMLDTSRNYYPVPDLLRTIDALAYNKMNVLHWHATDSQSWPFEFKSHPELAQKGAYSPMETYSREDVQKVIAFGQARGVRVYLEIDMPAHTASIGESHPEMMTCLDQFWGPNAAEPPAGQLDVTRQDVDGLVQDLISEAARLFPDTLYHTGGDEINGNCWKHNLRVNDHLAQNNLTTDQLWAQWTRKTLDFVMTTTQKRPVIWEDAVNAAEKLGLDRNVVVQIWNTPPANYTTQGYDVIVSSNDYFYLDCGNGGWLGNDDRYISPTQQQTTADTFNYGGLGGSWCAPYKTWQRIYTFDPTLGVSKDDKGKVLGVELALWSEQSGPTVLDSKLWPRAAAGAEIFWSGPYDHNNVRRTLESVQPRFNDWVYRLQARGIAAMPTQPKYCAKHPHACDLNPSDKK